VRRTLATACVLLAVLGAIPASAQIEPPPPDIPRPRLRIGQLLINPTIALTNIGFDQNVFNEPDALNPKTDFTFTVTPAVDLRYRLLRTQLAGSVREDLVWYQTYENQRSANTTLTGGWWIPFNRVTFTLSGRHANLSDRPGFEIDQRAPRTENEYGGSVEVRVMPKTFVGLAAHRLGVDFDEGTDVLSTNLRFELNRVTTTQSASLRYKWTPITSVSLIVARGQDRFEFSPLRDADSTAVSTLVQFDPLGILSGSASFGYTSFEPIAPGLPNFDGPTASVNVSYRLMGTMRITVGGVRDLEYSYDVNRPYYVQTGVTGAFTRSVRGPYDVLVRASIMALAYRDRAGVIIDVPNRVDHVYSYGAGVGYRLGKDSRLGVNLDEYRRTSPVPLREYDGLRFGTSITYGF
jgi:hypothetical protein